MSEKRFDILSNPIASFLDARHPLYYIHVVTSVYQIDFSNMPNRAYENAAYDCVRGSALQSSEHIRAALEEDLDGRWYRDFSRAAQL
jgi:hypothetical protein